MAVQLSSSHQPENWSSLAGTHLAGGENKIAQASARPPHIHLLKILCIHERKISKAYIGFSYNYNIVIKFVNNTQMFGNLNIFFYISNEIFCD